MKPCVFCSQLREAVGRAPWNEPFLESEHFLVVPSLGALVDGWSLLLPKKHFLSMGALPEHLRVEADSLQRLVEERLQSKFGLPLTVFEHGPSAEKHGTGCGVDHAHLHILPGDFDLLNLAQPFIPTETEWVEADWNERSAAYKAGLDYLFVKQGNKAAMLAVAADFGSQVFRKAIATKLGISREFNWREFPRHQRAIETRQLLYRETGEHILELEYAG